MNAASFSLPETVEQAIEILSRREDALPLAGGATLVALMNARLAAPPQLVSLRGIAELGEVRREADGSLRIGAMRRHGETAEQAELQDGQRLLCEAAAQIANPTVRNMGTLGGSISFDDPAADYPPALVAADASIEIASAAGRRKVPAEEFFVDWYETALQPGELVTAVLLPPAPAGSLGHYEKLARVTGDFAIASVALQLGMEGERCTHFRLAVGGCGPRPVRSADGEQGLLGGDLADGAVRAFAADIAAALDPPDDMRASADYRRKVVPRMIARAVSQTKARLVP